MNCTLALPLPQNMATAIKASAETGRTLNALFEIEEPMPRVDAMSSDCCGCNNYDER